MPETPMEVARESFSPEATQYIRQFVENVRGGVAVLDNELRYVIWNPYLEGLTSLSATTIHGKYIFDVFPEFRTDGTDELLRRALAGEPAEIKERFFQGADKNHKRWLTVEYTPLRIAGSVMGVIVTARDITDRKEHEEKIGRLTRIYAVLSGINSAIVRIHDRQKLLDEACRIACVEGAFLSAWIGLIDRESGEGEVVAWGGESPDYLPKVKLTTRPDTLYSDRPSCVAARTGTTVVCNDIEIEPALTDLREELLGKNHLAMAAFPIKVKDRTVGVLSLFANEAGFFDEAELKLLNELAGDIGFGLQYIEKEEELNYLAYYDPLTGLSNRKFFLQNLALAIQGASRSPNKLVVVVGDVRRFHLINDTFGRNAGDDVIKQMASRLIPFIRNPEFLARISSACFASILPDIADLTQIAHRVEKVRAEPLNKPFSVMGEPISIEMQVGIAIYPEDGKDAETLFGNADAALKKAKSLGIPYLFYEPSINARVADTLKLEHKLRRATENEEFVLHYQPKILSKTGEIVGLEALIRWNDPEEGLIPPGRFIPVLEETRLISKVGQWVISKALSDFRSWQDQGLVPPRVAVNVSIKQLRDPRLLDEICKALKDNDVSADALEVEITESLLMEDIDSSIETLAKIRSLGVTIAIDDFGTGYSSLSYLSKLPIHSLKIDRSFISSMVSDPDIMAIVSAVISLAHSLNLRVVAEGVETEEVSKFLRLLKCDEMQGFFFGRPVPANEISKLLASKKGLCH